MLKNIKLFSKEIRVLLGSPFFILLTICGNSLIGLASVLFFYLEQPINPKVTHYMDAVWWSFATATTTGYGDITPVTIAGKFLGIALMLLGMALFAVYTAVLAETILASRNLFRAGSNQRNDLR